MKHNSDIKIPTFDVINGDNLEVLSRFPDGFFDLTVTSDPYDEMRDYDDEGGKSWVVDRPSLATELFRVTAVGGVVVWVTKDQTIDGSESLTAFRTAFAFRDAGFNIETMIYRKLGTPASGSMIFYLDNFEFMFVFTKGRPKTVNHIRDRVNVSHVNASQGKRVCERRTKEGRRKIEDVSLPAPKWGRRYTVWDYPMSTKTIQGRFGQLVDHPAKMPFALARDHVVSWSNPGDRILDPFGGSGTTGEASLTLGRNVWLIDTSTKFCEDMTVRCSATLDWVTVPGQLEHNVKIAPRTSDEDVFAPTQISLF